MSDLVDPKMRDAILVQLQRIESRENVRILFACESGSRAWGFASSDSDYDVRFLYVRPTDWYLSVDLAHRRDVIELPIEDDLDINGWDLKKALGLFRKSNPPLLEWLGSPIVYLDAASVTDRLRRLVETYYSPHASLYHYLHMARRNFKDYLKGDRVVRKKYLYVLRPIACMLWIERGLGAVPTRFETALDAVVAGDVRVAIDRLLKEKSSGKELDDAPRDSELSGFIEAQLTRLERLPAAQSQPSAPWEPLNELFREALADVWEERV